jgi:hypothetical protein
VERRIDEARAIVERNDAHSLRENFPIDLLDGRVDRIENVFRVFAPAQENGSFDRIERIRSTTVATLRTSTGTPPAALTTVSSMSEAFLR